jgi:hypothetical protein
MAELPAMMFINGTKHWFKNGELHRDGDLPAIEWFDGTKFWYKHGIETTEEFVKCYEQVKTEIKDNVM